MFEIQVLDDYQTMSEEAANLMLDCMARNQQTLLCAATGQSPTGAYQAFSAKAGVAPDLHVLKLDEWGGLDRDDPSTCETYLRKYLIEPLKLTEERFHGFHADAAIPEEECLRVKDLIYELGGIDLCVLGMGADGHIGLNYPATDLPASAWVTPSTTLQHAMLNDALRRPTHGYTLGFEEILEARQLILLVNGKSKANALRRLADTGLTADFPASFLKLRPDLICLCDFEAATELS